MKSKHIAVIDDESSIRKTLSIALESEGYEVRLFSSGTEALGVIREDLPDLIVLDISMPGVDGITFCRIFRDWDLRIPVIFLSSRTDELSKIEALEQGGDDYLTKPYSLKELLVRITVCLRRAVQYAPPAAEETSRDGFFIDKRAYRVFCDNEAIPLSVTEFRIFTAMYGNRDRVFSRDELMELAYPEDSFISDRNIDSHITRIRKKIRKVHHDFERIESVYGLGYRYKN